MGLKEVFKRKPESEKQKKKFKMTDASAHSSILNYFGFNGFGHETHFVNFVAENNANLFNVVVMTNNDKMNNYLVYQEYYRKNWISLHSRSKEGCSGYIIFIINNQLFFQVVQLQNRKYDITSKLIECTIIYKPYNKNSVEVQFLETYKLINNSVTIERSIYNKQNEKLDFGTYNNNPNLKQSQKLTLTYIPIIPMRNKPNEEPDCAMVTDKIKALDIFMEQIILDVIINSPKFLINDQYGTNQDIVNDTINKLVNKNYFFTNTDAKDNPNGLINIISGNFKGKTLTDVYDWLVIEISKRIPIHVPSQEKSAQQSTSEANAVNISVVNQIEQKLIQYKLDTWYFLKMLMQVDRDLLNNKTFGPNALDTLTFEMELINPLNNQINKDIKENKDGQQPTSPEIKQ